MSAPLGAGDRGSGGGGDNWHVLWFVSITHEHAPSKDFRALNPAIRAPAIKTGTEMTIYRYMDETESAQGGKDNAGKSGSQLCDGSSL